MRRMMIRISTMLYLIFLGCPGNAQFVAVEHYTTKLFDCAIFPETSPAEIEGKRFSPTHDDVDKAEKALMEDLKSIKASKGAKDAQNEIVTNLPKYKLQIFGYIDKNGDKMLFVNCFRNDKDEDKELANSWLKELIWVEGGGVYFWTVKYNLAKNALTEFKISDNG